ncbi:MAG: YqjD family protein [Xanthobacteraceae bacterium]
MGNASTVSSSMREAGSEAREGVRDMGRAAGAASGDLQKDLQMLRDDFSHLAQQMADIVANRGNAAWQRARSGVDDVMSDAQDKGREAVDAMREVSDKFVEAVDESIKNRPYTTLAMAIGLGFLFGATWRR